MTDYSILARMLWILWNLGDLFSTREETLVFLEILFASSSYHSSGSFCFAFVVFSFFLGERQAYRSLARLLRGLNETRSKKEENLS